MKHCFFLFCTSLLSLAIGCHEAGIAKHVRTTRNQAAPDTTLSPKVTSLKLQRRLDWPQFRGPNGAGVSLDKGLPIRWGADKYIAWKIKLSGPGASCPIVFGNKVFVTSYSGYAVDPSNSGQMKQLMGHVTCLNRSDGKMLWSKKAKTILPDLEYRRRMLWHGYASSTPVADNERVYCFFGKLGVFAFDHKGNQIWQSQMLLRSDGFLYCIGGR